jgi:hypothetical protein
MAAHEHHPERRVPDFIFERTLRDVVRMVSGRFDLLGNERGGPLPTAIAAAEIEGPMARSGEQPSGRLRGEPVVGPDLGGTEKGVLHDIFDQRQPGGAELAD